MNKHILSFFVVVIIGTTFLQAYQAFSFNELVQKEYKLYEEQTRLFESNRAFIARIAGMYAPSELEKIASKNEDLSSDKSEKIVIKIMLDNSSKYD